MLSQDSSDLPRICHVTHAHYPITSMRLERQAKALVRRGYKVDVICLRKPGEPAWEVVDGVNVHRLPIRRHKGQGAAVQLFEYITYFFLASFRVTWMYWKYRYPIVHVHNLPDFLVFVALIPRLAGAKVVLDIHDVMPEFFVSNYGVGMDSLPVRLLKIQEKLSCLFANHVITVTELWRQSMIARGIPADKISVVMNVADDAVFYPQREESPRDKDADQFKLIYHGTLARRYGIDLIIEAVAALKDEIPGIHLTIHGAGEFLPELVALSETLELQSHVHFSTKLVPIEELPRLIERADVGVVPYRRDVFTDGILPTKMMEYMMLRMPVIAARTPIIEAYWDETMAEFFPPGDVEALAETIRYLYRHSDRCAELARNTEKFNRSYHWARISEDFIDIIDRLAVS